ncbi:arginine--tRNA ligase, chloroplastic/mitochondrial-like protein isoform X2 [Tanacetum coccineum]
MGTKASCQEGNSRLFIAQCNMAEMRVDQLRSTIIGDMLARMLEFSKVDVLRRNHVSDLGSQVTKHIHGRKPLIVVDFDGGFDYALTDLAVLWYRINVENTELIIYVTQQDQQEHFDMIFTYLTCDDRRVSIVVLGITSACDMDRVDEAKHHKEDGELEYKILKSDCDMDGSIVRQHLVEHRGPIVLMDKRLGPVMNIEDLSKALQEQSFTSMFVIVMLVKHSDAGDSTSNLKELILATTLRLKRRNKAKDDINHHGYRRLNLWVWICQISQEISQKRTRERMSDQEAKEIKAEAREIMPQPSTVSNELIYVDGLTKYLLNDSIANQKPTTLTEHAQSEAKLGDMGRSELNSSVTKDPR